VPRSGVVRRLVGTPVELARSADGAHDRDARRLDAVGILAGERGPGPAERVAHAAAFVALEHGGMLNDVGTSSKEPQLRGRKRDVRPVLMGRPWGGVGALPRRSAVGRRCPLP